MPSFSSGSGNGDGVEPSLTVTARAHVVRQPRLDKRERHQSNGTPEALFGMVHEESATSDPLSLPELERHIESTIGTQGAGQP